MPREIVIPRLGWSMDEGTFVGWLKADGDMVRAGEPLFELEGEKGVQEIEAVDDGVLKIPPQSPAPGAVVTVGTVIGFLAAPGEVVPTLGNGEASAKSAPSAPPKGPPAGPAARRVARRLNVSITEVHGSGPGGRVSVEDVQRAVEPKRAATGNPATSEATGGGSAVASPRAKRVARELRIDWTTLVGSGSGGRIRECDVRAAAEGTSALASSANIAAGRRTPISRRRRVIAQRMTASRQQTAPVTLTSRVNAANLVNLREQFKALGDSAGMPSYQDIIVKLVAGALQRHPLLAARWEEDAIVLPAADAIHIRIAVDAESGLVAPVIRNVAALSIGEIAAASRRLIERSQSGRITAAELEDGVFTISNLGAFGVDAFTPIINLPEVAILGLGAIRREAVVADDGRVVACHQMTLSLTFDHRVVDGAPAARFLQDVATAIANPSAWLLSTV
jgi:pyruvate dehydrogenase E2 component (dihydrolipoamide acetyltransferase)